MIITKDLIIKKRDKQVLNQEEIQFFVNGVTSGNISNEQISAMAMAIFLNDLTLEERKNLTLSMRNSGDVIIFEDLKDKPIVDKHSTGGVGDLVSIALAPIVAACGAYVPMITGKGLGHTGGTTDKMQSIPGYNPFPSVDLFKKITKNVGCAIIGQTSNLAPADKRIYTIRDVTGCVESIPLIASSILSKKLAAGIKYLVMDVKVGNGAFMQDMDKARDLARVIVDIANSTGTPTTALITDMNECLADSIGNSLEIIESIEFLKGIHKSDKLKDVTYALATEMLLTTNIAKSEDEAMTKINHAMSSGKAAEIFEKMVHALGGPSDILSSYQKIMPKTKISKPIYLKQRGYIQSVDNRKLGMTLVYLGGGRKDTNDTLDLSVGLTAVRKVGDYIDNNTPFAIIHAQSDEQISTIEDILNSCIKITDDKSKCVDLKSVYEKIK